jgi:hypothetical protein
VQGGFPAGSVANFAPVICFFLKRDVIVRHRSLFSGFSLSGR